MEPKDLKNSNEELKITPQEPDSVNEQNENEAAKSVKDTTSEKMKVVQKKESKAKTPEKQEEVASEVKAEEQEKTETIAKTENSETKEAAKKETPAEESITSEKDQAETSEGKEIKEAIVPEKQEEVASEAKAEEQEKTETIAETENSETKEAAKEETPTEESTTSEKDQTETSEEKGIKETVVTEKQEKVASEAKAEEQKKKETVEETKTSEKKQAEPSKREEESTKIDYSGKTEVELINALREIVNGDNNYEEIKENVDLIKFEFYKLHHAAIEKQKKEFYAEHDKNEDFVSEENIYEKDLKNLLGKLHHLKIEYNKKLEEEKEKNLQQKYQVIEEIKALINNEESINKTFHEFKELQYRWREIGLVPQAKLKDLWETYHHHVENFYDYIKINKELRDLDLKKNMEVKIGLCEKAEELLVEPSIIKAFNILQKYHEQWREIGPVPHEKKDELWERFKAATSKINKKHQEFFENRKIEQKKNLEAKTLLCEKAEEITASGMETHKDWDKKSKELIELQKVWRTIGFAPRKDNNRIYERFRNACDKFFNAKREFYNQNKELQSNNLQLKTDLCVQAESLKDSTDWKKTTDEYIQIQKRWKEIGPVPRKHSDAIWKRFRSACDYFFDKKSEHFSGVDSEQLENLKKKKELIEEVKAYTLSADETADLEQMKGFQRRFTEIGFVPYKDKDKIQNDFREAINVHFDNLRIDDKKKELLKFRTKMVNFTTSSKYGKMRQERERYMNKLKQLENDLALLDNNIGFFANTKNAESLIGDVNKKIASTKGKIELLKEKVRIIDAAEDEEE